MPLLQVLHELVRMQDEIAGQGDGRARRERQREHRPQQLPDRLGGRLRVQQEVRGGVQRRAQPRPPALVRFRGGGRSPAARPEPLLPTCLPRPSFPFRLAHPRALRSTSPEVRAPRPLRHVAGLRPALTGGRGQRPRPREARAACHPSLHRLAHRSAPPSAQGNRSSRTPVATRVRSCTGPAIRSCVFSTLKMPSRCFLDNSSPRISSTHLCAGTSSACPSMPTFRVRRPRAPLRPLFSGLVAALPQGGADERPAAPPVSDVFRGEPAAPARPSGAAGRCRRRNPRLDTEPEDEPPPPSRIGEADTVNR